MVTVQVTQAKAAMPSYLVQAAGFGKNLVKRVQSPQDAERWREIAPSRLLLEKLKGVLAQRKIAYSAKKFAQKAKWDCLNELHYFCDQVTDTSPQKIYRMVIAHQSKWRFIMPKNANKMNIVVEEIIAFCANNQTDNKLIYEFFLKNSHLTIAQIAFHFGISEAYASKLISNNIHQND